MPIIIIELMNGRIEKVHGVPDEYEVYVHNYDHIGFAEPYTVKLFDEARQAFHTTERPEQTTEPFTYLEG